MEISSHPMMSHYAAASVQQSGRASIHSQQDSNGATIGANAPANQSEIAPNAGVQKTESQKNGSAAENDADMQLSAEAQKLRAAEQNREKQEQLEISELAARDREVRAHEQAHMAAGGQYAGAATYEFKRGPDGVNYAVGGEVPISTGKEATPEATLRKAQIIRRAALAPAEPSPQDRSVAAAASQMESEARAEIAQAQNSRTEDSSTQAQETEEPNKTEPPTAGEAAPREPNTAPVNRPTGIVSYAEIGLVQQSHRGSQISTHA